MEQSKDKRTGWLRNLKPGDKVVIPEHRGFFSFELKRIVTILRVSPTGRITVKLPHDQEATYDENGYKRADHKWGESSRLIELTEQLKEEIYHTHLANSVSSFLDSRAVPFTNLLNLSNDELRTIHNLITSCLPKSEEKKSE